MGTQKAVDKLTYEDAFQELQGIVAALEDEGKSLEKSLELFERGQLLANYCAGLLDSAELKVKELTDEDVIVDIE